MMISSASKCLEDENEIKTVWPIIKKFWKILTAILIIFTIIYFTCFGCFLVLNDSTSWAAQTVTLSSEGPANETYPDSMGEYQLAEEEIERFDGVYNWYRHKDREDRFLMYNSLGKTQNTDLTIIVSYILPTEYRWYISLTNYTENVEGVIRSVLSGRIIYPEIQWEFLKINIPNCTTVR